MIRDPAINKSLAISFASAPIDDAGKRRTITVSAAGYAGHNRLMDGMRLPKVDNKPKRKPVASFVMACLSDRFFSESLREDWRSGRVGFDETISRFEGELLREALERWEWNQTRAASELGITRRVLKLKMDRFGLAEHTAGE